MPWWGYALLSALFAGLVGVLGKVGVQGVDSSLATAVRAVIMMAVTVGFVALRGKLGDVRSIPGRSMLFIFFSGLAGALSWLAGFAALQIGQASQVAPIDKLSLVLTVIFAVLFLHEKLDWVGVAGIGMIVVGTYLVAFGVHAPPIK